MDSRSFRSRSRSHSRAGAESWQLGRDYWFYMQDDVFPGTASLIPRGRTNLFDDGWMGGSDYGLASVPSAATPSRPSPVRLLLIDTYNPAPTPTPPSAYYDWSPEDQSRLSQEDQKQAISKLRKQLYNPHMSNIIRRLGSTKSNTHPTASSLPDDYGKRCAVCLEDFETKQFVTVTPCNHMFHEECIVPWVKSQGKCPVCRFDIADDPNDIRQRSSGSAVAAASRRGGIPLRI